MLFFTLLSLILGAFVLSVFLYGIKHWLKSENRSGAGFFIKLLAACTLFLSLELLIYESYPIYRAYQAQNFSFAESSIGSTARLSDHPLDDQSEDKPETREIQLDPKSGPGSDDISLDYDFLTHDKIRTKFSDIAGMQEAKTEVSEVVDFLNNPKKYERLGAKIPRGILLYGPPGTGKTLLARATAGEANVSFIAVSGAAFDEQWVGVGAARVRKLFDIARQHKPCIIFIDEMDAVAPKRTAETESSGRVQTINQLLGEMDNIDDKRNEGIIVMGATNRLEFVDDAILRPGRFDRKVYIRLPNLAERQDILKVYLKKTVAAKDIDIAGLAGTTIGFSGADLKNLVNEAAIYAARNNQPEVTKQDFEYAKDKITLGLPVGSAIITDADRKVTAYHEAGHAIVGIFSPDYHFKFNKVTIGLRDETLGVTHFATLEENYLDSRKFLEDSIAMALGGRAAEELIFGKMNVTGGAHNDMQRATKLAQQMVLSLGLSDLSSVTAFDVLRYYPNDKAYQAIENILETGHQKASKILAANIDKLHALAKALLEKETLDYDEVMSILKPVPAAPVAVPAVSAAAPAAH